MFALVLTLVFSAADVAVVERSTLGLPPSAGAQLRARLVLALEAVKLKAELVAEPCADRACLQSIARERKRVVVGMTVVKCKKGLTVDLDAVDGEAVVLQQTFLLTSDRLEQSPEAQVFAHQLSARVVKDTPLVEAPKPDVREPVVTVQEAPAFVDDEAPRPSPAPTVLGVTSAGVGAAGLALLIGGVASKGQLDATLAQPVVTQLNRSQAQAQADTANGLMAGGAVALGLGVTGAVTALIMALSQEPR